jgi:hypothetical protein
MTAAQTAKRVFISALVWFTVTSVLCGLYFPLRFLPDWLAGTLYLATPFPSILQIPLDVLVGAADGNSTRTHPITSPTNSAQPGDRCPLRTLLGPLDRVPLTRRGLASPDSGNPVPARRAIPGQRADTLEKNCGHVLHQATTMR